MNCLLRAWHAHEAELLGWLRRHAGDPDSADDLLQEVFLKAATRQQGFCALDNPRAWLFTVARNALIDRHRTRRLLRPLPDEFGEGLALVPSTADPAPLDALADCLPQALARLSAADRQALILCDLEGAPQHELARQSGLSLPGAKSRLQRARLRLRERLVQDCQVRFDDQGKVCCLAPREAC